MPAAGADFFGNFEKVPVGDFEKKTVGFYRFFCASVDVGRFLYLNKYASGLGSTNLSEDSSV